MKISFPEGGYVEITKSADKVMIVVQAIDAINTRKTITNACELTIEQFQSLCSDLNDQ